MNYHGKVLIPQDYNYPYITSLWQILISQRRAVPHKNIIYWLNPLSLIWVSFLLVSSGKSPRIIQS